MRIILQAALLGLLLPCAALSQQNTDGFDFDTLAACSVVYARISELYSERKDPAQAGQFQATAAAYSASAYHTLKDLATDQDQAYPWAEDRMIRVSDSLNQSAESNPNGEMGVIEEWLPYCDALGAGVENLLAQREQVGW